MILLAQNGYSPCGKNVQGLINELQEYANNAPWNGLVAVVEQYTSINADQCPSKSSSGAESAPAWKPSTNESATAVCETAYKKFETAAEAYKAQEGVPAPDMGSLTTQAPDGKGPFLNEQPISLLSGVDYNIYVSDGVVSVDSPGHAATPGPANCVFASFAPTLP
jgi:hypothetical protein